MDAESIGSDWNQIWAGLVCIGLQLLLFIFCKNGLGDMDSMARTPSPRVAVQSTPPMSVFPLPSLLL